MRDREGKGNDSSGTKVPLFFYIQANQTGWLLSFGACSFSFYGSSNISAKGVIRVKLSGSAYTDSLEAKFCHKFTLRLLGEK